MKELFFTHISIPNWIWFICSFCVGYTFNGLVIRPIQDKLESSK